MPITFLTTALLIVSTVTNATVEAIKKLLNKADANYSSNLLAAITSVVVAFAISGGYLILNSIPFSVKVGVEIVVLMYLSFLTSTVGYDKVVQMIKQLKGSDV